MKVFKWICGLVGGLWLALYLFTGSMALAGILVELWAGEPSGWGVSDHIVVKLLWLLCIAIPFVGCWWAIRPGEDVSDE